MASISRSDFLAIFTSPKLGEERVEPLSTLPKGYSYLHELLGFPRLEKAARFFALTIACALTSFKILNNPSP